MLLLQQHLLFFGHSLALFLNTAGQQSSLCVLQLARNVAVQVVPRLQHSRSISVEQGFTLCLHAIFSILRGQALPRTAS